MHAAFTRKKIRLVKVNAKYFHLKRMTCKGTFRSQSLAYIQSCWYFQPPLWDLFLVFLPCCPSPLLSGSTPPPPSPCVNKYTLYTVCIQCVRGGGAMGVLLQTIFWKSFTLCSWPDSEPSKFLDHPKQKPRRVGSLRQINNSRKVPLQVNIFIWGLFALPSMSLFFLRLYFTVHVLQHSTKLIYGKGNVTRLYANCIFMYSYQLYSILYCRLFNSHLLR